MMTAEAGIAEGDEREVEEVQEYKREEKRDLTEAREK